MISLSKRPRPKVDPRPKGTLKVWQRRARKKEWIPVFLREGYRQQASPSLVQWCLLFFHWMLLSEPARPASPQWSRSIDYKSIDWERSEGKHPHYSFESAFLNDLASVGFRSDVRCKTSPSLWNLSLACLVDSFVWLLVSRIREESPTADIPKWRALWHQLSRKTWEFFFRSNPRNAYDLGLSLTHRVLWGYNFEWFYHNIIFSQDAPTTTEVIDNNNGTWDIRVSNCFRGRSGETRDAKLESFVSSW